MAKLLECETCGGKVSENARSCPHCGEDRGETKTEKNRKEKQINEYVKTKDKSRFVSFILILFFSSFGLFYTSFKAGILMSIINAIFLYGTVLELQNGVHFSKAMLFTLLFMVYILPLWIGDNIIVKRRKKLKAEAGIAL